MLLQEFTDIHKSIQESLAETLSTFDTKLGEIFP